MKAFLVAAILESFLIPVFASPLQSVSQYGSRIWQTENGLPHNNILAVCQTADDFLWIATPQGLTRFDSAEFKTYDWPTILKSKGTRMITTLLPSRNGELWIGTATNEVIEFRSGGFQKHILPENAGVTSLCERDDRSLWIGTTAGLIQANNEIYSRVTSVTNAVLAISDGKSNLWFGTESGLKLFQVTTGMPTSINNVPGKAHALCTDQDGGIWIGADDLLIHHKGKAITAFGRNDGLSGSITALHRDNRGTLWIGTTRGLFRMNGSRIVAKLDESEKPFETVHWISEDHEGNIWIGTNEGLVELWPKPFEAITREDGLVHPNVVSLFEDTVGTIWAATSGGLNFFNADGTKGFFNRSNSELTDSVLTLCPRADGALWAGGSDGSLALFRAGMSVNYAPALGLVDSEVRVVYEDRSGVLWAGAGENVYRYFKGDSTRFTAIDGLPGGNVRTIIGRRDGSIWIGTDRGLALWNGNGFSRLTNNESVSSNPILSLCEDRFSNLWIGTSGGGLHRLNKGKVTGYSSKDGLREDTIFDIIVDDADDLWLSSVQGVFRVKRSQFDDFDRGVSVTISCTSFGKSDGMPSSQCNGLAKPGVWKSRNGRLWFATTRGVASVDPQLLAKEPVPPRTLISSVSVDGKELQENGAGEFVASPGAGKMEFHFSALSFTAPDRNRFKYKLEGIDPDWVKGETHHVAHYNNIKPGNYRFRVRACNSSGVWNEAGAMIALRLQPFFWQTWWFRFCVVFSSLFLAAAVARFLTQRRLQRNIERLQQQHAIETERARIAADMHDDLGAQLTELRLLAELAANKNDFGEVKACIAKMLNASRDVVRNLDAIVWSVNPKNDTLDHLISYMIEQFERFLSIRSIRCHFDAPVDLPNGPLSSEVRHHVYLAAKEVMNNIVKHSQASEVLFQVRVTNGKLFIEVADDGRGFEVSHEPSSGNGLQNISKRMKAVGGTAVICSELGRGTKIRLEMPLIIG